MSVARSQASGAEIIVGVGGWRRNATAAVSVDGQIVAACEQERLSRSRGIGMTAGGLPAEAIDTVLRLAGCRATDVSTYAAAEAGIGWPPGHPSVRLGHHAAHAAAAFQTSPFAQALVLVCDRHGDPELSLWRATERGIAAADWPWHGPAFASLYAAAVEAIGLAPGRDEHKLEALARLQVRTASCDADTPLLRCDGHGITVHPAWTAYLRGAPGRSGWAPAAAARFGHGVQQHLGRSLLQLLHAMAKAFAGETRHLCLAGGLFYNTWFNTLVRESGLFERTFVPVNPGNPGLAVGSALVHARRPRAPVPLPPFLGPEYGPEEIKATLDNCKLSYEYVNEQQLLDRTVDALLRDRLVGWFQGRMEWGPRALGHRSILACPLSRYVLENLNVFLKGREPYRSYGVSICDEDMPRYFDGPLSPVMEYEHTVRDPELFQHVMPVPRSRIRVQTIGATPARLRLLLKQIGAATGVPVLVNTSFNGFHEPIVCTPRDAVRVFYGTGLDMLVIGNFILRK